MNNGTPANAQSDGYRWRWLALLGLLIALLMVQQYYLFAAFLFLAVVRFTMRICYSEHAKKTGRTAVPQAKTRRYVHYGVTLAVLALILLWVYLWLSG